VACLLGQYPGVCPPVIPGRAFCGLVIDGPLEILGSTVFGCGGRDLGYHRDGAHSQFMAVPESAVVEKPENVSVPSAAVLGVPYVTAWLALHEKASARTGEVVVVFGAGSLVGRATLQLGRWLGARCIAVVEDAVDKSAVSEFCDQVFVLVEDPAPARATSLATASSDPMPLTPLISPVSRRPSSGLATYLAAAPVESSEEKTLATLLQSETQFVELLRETAATLAAMPPVAHAGDSEADGDGESGYGSCEDGSFNSASESFTERDLGTRRSGARSPPSGDRVGRNSSRSASARLSKSPKPKRTLLSRSTSGKTNSDAKTSSSFGLGAPGILSSSRRKRALVSTTDSGVALGVDVAIDCVGGRCTQYACQVAGEYGRVVALAPPSVSSSAGGNSIDTIPLDMADFFRKRLELHAVDALDVDVQTGE